MTDYDHLIKNGFVKNLVKISGKNPRCYWLENDSNENVSKPEIDKWIKQEASLRNIYVNQTSGYLKAALKDVLDNGKGVKDASAITLIIAKYNLMKGWNAPDNTKVREVRTILLGTSSLNQTPIGSGQIHAEHITAATLRDKILNTEEIMDLVKDSDGPVKLISIDLLSYAGKYAKGKKKIDDFLPCPSCQKNLKAVFDSLKEGEVEFKKVGLVAGTD